MSGAGAAVGSQIADSQFAKTPLGHAFVLRAPLAKATAKRCRECGANVYDHARTEVSDTDVLSILNTTADTTATAVAPGLLIGSFQAAIAESKKSDQIVVLNCAGKKLHNFFPKSRAPFDALRAGDRLKDLEWDDTDEFLLELAEVKEAVQWMCEQIADKRNVLVNCAQGKSRSGTMACAYLMATNHLSAADALGLIQASRPLVQPNAGFMRQLRDFEGLL
eukprot:m.189209 g.189209  ORF g.189209 m.189209 type:complete len:221 (-) comp15103_c0_seq2:431-1093(-)